MHPLKMSAQTILERAEDLLTVRTARCNYGYAVYSDGEYVLEGPYAAPDGNRDANVAFLEQNGYRHWTAGLEIVDMRGTYWLCTPRPSYASTTMQLLSSDSAALWSAMSRGLFETLAALYCLETGVAMQDVFWCDGAPCVPLARRGLRRRDTYEMREPPVLEFPHLAEIMLDRVRCPLKHQMSVWAQACPDVPTDAVDRLLQLAPTSEFRCRALLLKEAVLRATEEDMEPVLCQIASRWDGDAASARVAILGGK